MWQAIIWTQRGLGYWRISASLGLSELINQKAYLLGIIASNKHTCLYG